MEDNTPERTSSRPGIAEAIHPEIGNGVSWEPNRHLSLLRNPDPTKELDSLLEIEIDPTLTSNSSKPTQEDDIVVIPPVVPTMDDMIEDIAVIRLKAPSETELIAPPVEKKEKSKSVRNKKSKLKDTESEGISESAENLLATNERLKTPKAGKLVRKAAKTARRKEEEEEKKASTPDIALTESSLSPYTQWLKGLRGSDYVHPYEDDFAYTQGTGPGKEGISETYADLLATQGYKEQAVEMYLKLIEKYPEKSGFFAAKIEALQ